VVRKLAPEAPADHPGVLAVYVSKPGCVKLNSGLRMCRGQFGKKYILNHLHIQLKNDRKKYAGEKEIKIMAA
jgi:hypothetical protein